MNNNEVKFVPATLNTVASQKLQDEVEKELKIPDPVEKEKSIAKLMENIRNDA